MRCMGVVTSDNTLRRQGTPGVIRMLALRFLTGNNRIVVAGDLWKVHRDEAEVSGLLDAVCAHQRRQLERQRSLGAEHGASAAEQALRQLAEIDVVPDETGHLKILRTLDRTLLADTTMLRWVMAQAEPQRAAELGIPPMLAPKAQRRAVRGLAQSILEGRLDDAAAVAEAVRALGIADPVVCIMTGLTHLWRDEPEPMLECFRLAVRTAPTKPQGAQVKVLAHEVLARGWFAVGECGRAMQEQVVAIETRRGAKMPAEAARYRLAVYASGAGRYATAMRGMASLISQQPRFLLVALCDEDLAPVRDSLRRGLGNFVDKAEDDVTRRMSRVRVKYDLMVKQARSHTCRELEFYGEALEELEAVVGSGAIESYMAVLRDLPAMEARLDAINDLEDVRIQTEVVEQELLVARKELEVTVEKTEPEVRHRSLTTATYVIAATCLMSLARIGLHLAVWMPAMLTDQAESFWSVGMAVAVPASVVLTLVGAAWILAGLSRNRRQPVSLAVEEQRAVVTDLERRAGRLRDELGQLTEQVTLTRAA